jgi:hypothetical protein
MCWTHSALCVEVAGLTFLLLTFNQRQLRSSTGSITPGMTLGADNVEVVFNRFNRLVRVFSGQQCAGASAHGM